MVEKFVAETGRGVGYQRDPEHLGTEVTSGDCFEDSGHTDQIRTQSLQHADLGRRFVGAAEQTGIHAFGQSGVDGASKLLKAFRIGFGHVDESGWFVGRRRRAGHWRGTREVELIADQHWLANWPVGVEPPGGVGENHRATTSRNSRADPVNHSCRRVPLIEMRSSSEHQNPHRAQSDRASQVAMTSHRRLRKPGQVGKLGVGNQLTQLVGRGSPTRPQHHDGIVTGNPGPMRQLVGRESGQFVRIGAGVIHLGASVSRGHDATTQTNRPAAPRSRLKQNFGGSTSDYQADKKAPPMKGVPILDREEDFTADPAELFFDLSFVFAFSRLVIHLVEHPSWSGVGEFALLFSLIWFGWANFTWTANAVAGNSRPVRAVFMVATAISLPMAASVDGAFDNGGPLFAVTIVALFAMPIATTLATMSEHREVVASALRLTGPIVVAMGLMMIGGFIDGDGRTLSWAAAVAVLLFTTIKAGSGEWLVRPGHFAERHGLIVIIALGEVLVAVGTPVVTRLADGEAIGGITIVALTAAGLFAGLMWWLFFDRPLPALEHGHNQLDSTNQIGRFARDVYTYGHFPVVAGVLVSAAAMEEIMAHPDHSLPLEFRWMLLAGLALFLGGIAVSVYRAFQVLAVERLTGAALIGAATVLLGGEISGVVLLIVVDVALLLVLLAEHYRVEVQGRQVRTKRAVR